MLGLRNLRLHSCYEMCKWKIVGSMIMVMTSGDISINKMVILGYTQDMI